MTATNLEVGKLYDVNHTRKGKWRATLVKILGEGTDDVWYSLSDDPDSYVRASLCTLTEVTP